MSRRSERSTWNTATRRSAGIAALERFWGRSNGGQEAYAALEARLQEIPLTKDDLAHLARNLPVPESAHGTTAAKITRARQCLELLPERV